MEARTILGAAGAAAAGALVWAAISYFTGYEIGWIAWGIGAAVGGASYALGGDGNGMGALCAVLAFAAIFFGKWFAVDFAVQKGLSDAAAEHLSQADYQEVLDIAAALVALEQEPEYETRYPAFMIAYEYTEARKPAQVTQEEVADFMEYTAPYLRDMHANPPEYTTWRKQTLANIEGSFRSEFSTFDAISEDLNLFDVVFVLLGVVTAFRVGSGQ